MGTDKRNWRPIGRELLTTAKFNKGSAFTAMEREEYHLRGLLPAAICTQEVQLDRALGNLRRKVSNIERYIFLMALLERNERLFYRMLIENIEEFCRKYSVGSVIRFRREDAAGYTCRGLRSQSARYNVASAL